MAEYIEREALMEAFRSYMKEKCDRERCGPAESCEACETKCLWYKVTTKAPAADVEPVRHGRWIEVKRYDGYGLRVMQECNVCGCCENWLANYCHNCGARMDLEVSE